MPSNAALRKSAKSATADVVATLRREILAAPTGAYIGSESELLQKLGVSSPTLRQAARLLERQQLVSVERGPKGGYYGRRPTSRATAGAAALYLQVAGTTRSQVRQASLPLMIQASRLAAQANDTQRLTAFRAAYDAVKALAPDAPAPAVLAKDRALVGAMLELAGNPAVELFLKVIYRLGRLHEARLHVFNARPDRTRAWVEHALELAEAVFERDGRLAELMIVRGEALIDVWFQDLAGVPEIFELRPHQSLQVGDVTAVQLAAETMRGEILQRAPGAFFGSEEELASRLRVSRHTIRQAAALLQHDQVLETKRGIGGGYIGRRPDIDAVVNSAALYLELNNGTLRDLIVASQCLAVEACRLAAGCVDEARREALGKAVAAFSDAPDDAPDATQQFWRAEQKVMDAILNMAGNPPIKLFVRSMYRYGASENPWRVAPSELATGAGRARVSPAPSWMATPKSRPSSRAAPAI
jgi:GntR family transcriptional regulator, transcriptional repressor for pyruvate dehydrogenase complex